MNAKLTRIVMAGTVAGLFGAGAALAQPTINPQGGGTGDAQMDHSRMGGTQGRPGTGAPSLNPQGGGTGSSEMDHGRMGGSRGASGGTPSLDPQGGGTGNAEMTHPGSPGTGHGHDQNPAPRRRN